MGRLILVEGFPGAGKSTTAQFLARRLARLGQAVRWVYEGESPHPLVPRPPAGGYRSWEPFVEARVARWRAFAELAAEHDVTVIPESALLQGPVYAMLTRDAEPAAIEALVRRLAEAVAPLKPRLVYLARRDPEAAFRAIGQRRGMPWLLQHVQASMGFAFTQARGLSGLPGLLAYWRAHGELCDRLVERLPLPTLVLEGGPGGWPERRRRICEFVDVPFEDEPAVEPATAARLAGRYGDGTRQVTVEVVDGRLVLRGILWFANALLPVAGHVFDVEGWPLRVLFEEDAAGAVAGLRCEGSGLPAGPTGVFTRLAA